MALFRKAKESNDSPKPDPQPVEIRSEPGKAEGTTTLIVIGVVLILCSLFTKNPVLIVASIVLLFLFSVVASALQRSEEMYTVLWDIRELLNLQTVKLNSLSRAIQFDGDAAKAATLAPEAAENLRQLRDIAEESRDILSTLHK